jgi:hypothetical protein
MKKNFNIICSSVDADSYQGDIYDASYYVNFGTLIDDEDYKKRFKITLRLKSTLDADILSTENYICNLIVNSKVYCQQNLGLSYTLGILNKYTADSNTGFFALDCSPNDNPPIVIHTLDRMSSIRLQFNILETGALFVGMPLYIAILNFEEI